MHEAQALQIRDKRMLALVKAGGADIGIILEADFGSRGLPGIKTPDWPDAPFVAIKSMLESRSVSQGGYRKRKRDLSRAGGFVQRGENVIYVNPQYINPKVPPGKKINYERLYRYLSDLVSHEAVHILQGARGAKTFANANMAPLMKPTGKAGGPGAGIVELFRGIRRWWLEFRAWRYYKFSIKDYFSSEAEIQARMHQLMVHGCAGWPRMPASRVELFAALFNMGFKMPPHIRKNWLKRMPEGRKARKAFKCSKAMRIWNATTILHLNMVYDWLGTTPRRAYLCGEVYPAIYADLLSLYGVRDAHELMR